MGNECGGPVGCCSPVGFCGCSAGCCGCGCCCSDGRTTIEKKNATNVSTFTAAWNNAQYGGTVVQPLGAIRELKTGGYTVTYRDRKNTLEQEILQIKINSLYGGGLYKLEKVQQFSENQHYFMDIFILTESIENQEHIKKLKDADEKYRQSLLDKKVTTVFSNTPKEFLKFDDIKDSLNGYARIIYYKASNGNPAPENNEIESLVEGKFTKGLKDGYCRGISALNGSCAVGYHKEGLPFGKWCNYKSDGFFAQPEGLYEGIKCTQPLEIKSFEQPILATQK